MKEKIKNFILETFMSGENKLEYDEPLFESGLIDSLGFIKLLQFIENKFNVSVDMSEVTMDKFGTINDIEQLINEKLNH
jgi:D-alanine--poly(phosphoribitol) ligase subunit 2